MDRRTEIELFVHEQGSLSRAAGAASRSWPNCVMPKAPSTKPCSSPPGCCA